MQSEQVGECCHKQDLYAQFIHMYAYHARQCRKATPHWSRCQSRPAILVALLQPLVKHDITSSIIVPMAFVLTSWQGQVSLQSVSTPSPVKCLGDSKGCACRPAGRPKYGLGARHVEWDELQALRGVVASGGNIPHDVPAVLACGMARVRKSSHKHVWHELQSKSAKIIIMAYTVGGRMQRLPSRKQS